MVVVVMMMVKIYIWTNSINDNKRKENLQSDINAYTCISHRRGAKKKEIEEPLRVFFVLVLHGARVRMRACV
jgi:hypothetical protein